MVEIHLLCHELYAEIAGQSDGLPSVSSLLLMLLKHLPSKQLALTLFAANMVIPGIFWIIDKGLIVHIVPFIIVFHKLFHYSF